MGRCCAVRPFIQRFPLRHEAPSNTRFIPNTRSTAGGPSHKIRFDEMAEVAGLVLGTLALIGVFEDCVEMVSQIAAAKSMGQDYEILETKLDIEKTLLLQWADRSKLFNRDQYDTRLDIPETRHMTERILCCIRSLLQDSKNLQNRYGVQPATNDNDIKTSEALSRRLMSRFYQQSQELTLWHNKQVSSSHGTHQAARPKEDNPRKGFATSIKIKWVIRDREKFERLIRDLSDLVASLNKILPPSLPPLQQEAANRNQLREEVRKVQNVGMLRAILHASTDDNLDLIDEANEAIKIECTRLILSRLWFRLIDERRENITEAHRKTLMWAMQPPASSANWSDLSEWLRSGRDIYWVSGKPGSGKSTLMKLLYEHPDVLNMLRDWAGDRTLTMASFFLWNLGSPEQNSQQGLARGLLYHVLKANPSLISIILPNMWQEAQSGSGTLRLPSDTEMGQAFARLGDNVKNGAYAFFIDGLDEYVGDHRQGISFLQQLARCSNVKLLISSRPIDACVAAFSTKPKLSLQELTKGDIELVITDAVRSHPYVADLKALDDAFIERLIDDLKAKADGVFLWVILACRSLLEGFEAFDNPSELQRRVDELPPELQDLFRHILGKISPRYLTQAAKLLLICYQHRLLGISDNISTVALAWADGNNLSMPAPQKIERRPLEEHQARCAMLEGRLRSRCMGLLEVHRPAQKARLKAHDGLVESSVDFMHRTVFEFLNTPKTWDMDCLQVKDDGFDVTGVLSSMSAYLLCLQETPLTTSQFTCLLARQSVAYVQEIDRTTPSNTWSALEQLAFALLHKRKDTVQEDLPTYGYNPSDEDQGPRIAYEGDEEQFFGLDQGALPLDHAALLLAIEADLTIFVPDQSTASTITLQRSAQHLSTTGSHEKYIPAHARSNNYISAFLSAQRRRTLKQNGAWPLLYHAMKKPLLSKITAFTNIRQRLPSCESVRTLLRWGCDVNEKFAGPAHGISTPWETWRTLYHVGRDSPEDMLQAAEITLMMLHSNAALPPADSGVLALPRSNDWRDELVTEAGKWLVEADHASGDFDCNRLMECCNGIMEAIHADSHVSNTSLRANSSRKDRPNSNQLMPMPVRLRNSGEMLVRIPST